MSDAVDARWLQQRLDVQPPAAALLARYVGLLLQWNRRINLTAARSVDAIVDEHLVDCVACLAHLPQEAGRLLDVGSGGGFPGIVIACARPTLAVTMLEPVHKKQAFLAAAIRELPLPNAQAYPERLEEHLRRPDFQPYDVASSRATWPVPRWLELGRDAVRRGGTILAFEGRERHELPTDAERHLHPRDDRRRAVIVAHCS